MSATVQTTTPASPKASSKRYRHIYAVGYRDIFISRPGGTLSLQRTPLRLEDNLQPQFADLFMHSALHSMVIQYLFDVFRVQANKIPELMVLEDVDPL